MYGCERRETLDPGGYRSELHRRKLHTSNQQTRLYHPLATSFSSSSGAEAHASYRHCCTLRELLARSSRRLQITADLSTTRMTERVSCLGRLVNVMLNAFCVCVVTHDVGTTVAVPLLLKFLPQCLGVGVCWEDDASVTAAIGMATVFHLGMFGRLRPILSAPGR